MAEPKPKIKIPSFLKDPGSYIYMPVDGYTAAWKITAKRRDTTKGERYRAELYWRGDKTLPFARRTAVTSINFDLPTLPSGVSR